MTLDDSVVVVERVGDDGVCVELDELPDPVPDELTAVVVDSDVVVVVVVVVSTGGAMTLTNPAPPADFIIACGIDIADNGCDDDADGETAFAKDECCCSVDNSILVVVPTGCEPLPAALLLFILSTVYLLPLGCVTDVWSATTNRPCCRFGSVSAAVSLATVTAVVDKTVGILVGVVTTQLPSAAAAAAASGVDATGCVSLVRRVFCLYSW